MLKEERHQYILRELEDKYRVYITTLSKDLRVSDDTLRRDLTELDAQGLLTKVHGGAIIKSGIPIDFAGRLQTGMEEKKGMAAKVIPLIKEHDVLLIDGGTSNLEVVRQLPRDMKLTIYTNSFPVINELLEHPQIEVVFMGGNLFRSSRVTLGISVFQALQTLRADWLFLGVCSIHPKYGLTDPNKDECAVKRMMMERAMRIVVMADSHKLNTAENYVIGSLHDIDYLVVEDSKVEKIKDEWPTSDYIIL